MIERPTRMHPAAGSPSPARPRLGVGVGVWLTGLVALAVHRLPQPNCG